MGAPAPINPLDIIDTEEMDAQIYYLETYFTGTAAALSAGAGAVTVGAGLLVFSAGALLTYDLLGNKRWNNFWVGVGGRLNDVWHRAAGFLFSSPGIGAHEVGQMIQLSQHVTMRGTRQLVSNIFGRVMVAQAALIANMRHIAKVVNANAARTVTLVNSARLYAYNLAHGVEVRAMAREAAALDAARGYARAVQAEGYQHVLHSVWSPLQNEIITLNGELQDLRKEVAAQKALINGSLVPKIVAASAAAGVALNIAKAAKAWEDDCGEPMCQSVGPKTDWGKLFKKFGPKALYILLAAVAASDPEAVEGIAKEFGDTFGPTLAHWTESWIGLTGGDRDADTRKVGEGVGTIDLFG